MFLAKEKQIEIEREQIVKIINNVSTNKAHGCDGIAVEMLKLCAIDSSPLLIRCMSSGVFQDSWKYANVQPVYKKEKKVAR